MKDKITVTDGKTVKTVAPKRGQNFARVSKVARAVNWLIHSGVYFEQKPQVTHEGH